MFDDAQRKLLQEPLSRANVKTRKQGGRSVSYVEGWHVIAEANRIFGFDGWSSRTFFLQCVASRERSIGDPPRPGWGVTYVAQVELAVGGIIRTGTGIGHGIDADLGQAHESAAKEAETDARKRALMTFGNVFGLALYDKDQTNVMDEDEITRVKIIAEIDEEIEKREGADLYGWWNSDNQRRLRRDIGLTPDELEPRKNRVAEKLRAAGFRPEATQYEHGRAGAR